MTGEMTLMELLMHNLGIKLVRRRLTAQLDIRLNGKRMGLRELSRTVTQPNVVTVDGWPCAWPEEPDDGECPPPGAIEDCLEYCDQEGGDLHWDNNNWDPSFPELKIHFPAFFSWRLIQFQAGRLRVRVAPQMPHST